MCIFYNTIGRIDIHCCSSWWMVHGIFEESIVAYEECPREVGIESSSHHSIIDHHSVRRNKLNEGARGSNS